MLGFGSHGEESGPPLDERIAALARVDALNAQFRHFGTSYFLEAVLTRDVFNKIAMVSSFGADSAVLLHLIAHIDRDVPVFFIDTHLLFPETLAYQKHLAAELGLTNVRTIHASDRTLQAYDPYGALRLTDPDACCDLRKTNVLNAALSGYDAWITGRKRHQATTRRRLQYFDLDEETGRIKINPLIDWTPSRIAAHLTTHNLPRHPLVAKGYASIGCAPCTTAVRQGEDSRAGRWRGTQKTECGLHRPATLTGENS